MLVIGAGGLATQLIEDLVELKSQDVVFWSETDTKYNFIKDLYPLINSDEEVKHYFENVSRDFLLCIGKGKGDGRIKMADRFTQLGGVISSFISPFSRISKYGTHFGEGVIVLNQVNIEPDVVIGNRCLINKKANLGHGTIIGADCEIGPCAIFAGEVEVGEDSYIGMASVLYPKIKIGKNVTIATGSIVTKNVPDNVIVAGNPAQIRVQKKVYES